MQDLSRQDQRSPRSVSATRRQIEHFNGALADGEAAAGNAAHAGSIPAGATNIYGQVALLVGATRFSASVGRGFDSRPGHSSTGSHVSARRHGPSRRPRSDATGTSPTSHGPRPMGGTPCRTAGKRADAEPDAHQGPARWWDRNAPGAGAQESPTHSLRRDRHLVGARPLPDR